MRAQVWGNGGGTARGQATSNAEIRSGCMSGHRCPQVGEFDLDPLLCLRWLVEWVCTSVRQALDDLDLDAVRRLPLESKETTPSGARGEARAPGG